MTKKRNKKNTHTLRSASSRISVTRERMIRLLVLRKGMDGKMEACNGSCALTLAFALWGITVQQASRSLHVLCIPSWSPIIANHPKGQKNSAPKGGLSMRKNKIRYNRGWDGVTRVKEKAYNYGRRQWGLILSFAFQEQETECFFWLSRGSYGVRRAIMTLRCHERLK